MVTSFSSQQQKMASERGPHQASDPLAVFHQWFEEAVRCGVKEPRAMSVATVDGHGNPDARMILMKEFDANGVVFYTNLNSPKAIALRNNPNVALCFYWPEIDKQVRIRGRAEPVSDAEADAYFATRARLSQISAWASKQSGTMRGYFELEAEVAKAAIKFGIGRVPRPAFWSGFRVRPDSMEFWNQKPFRRHQRIAYERIGEAWNTHWLYP